MMPPPRAYLFILLYVLAAATGSRDSFVMTIATRRITQLHTHTNTRVLQISQPVGRFPTTSH